MSLTQVAIKRRMCFISKIRFDLRRKVRATIEHGHGNHLRNETSSVAYWYQLEPHKPFQILPVQQRKLVLKAEDGGWLIDETAQTPQPEPVLNDEMKKLKAQWGGEAES